MSLDGNEQIGAKQMTRVETWAFLANELEHVDACHAADEFVWYLPGEDVGVVVFRSGKAANRYSDGTVGVPEFVRRLAEREAILYRRREEIACWRKVKVNEAGWPVRVSKSPCLKGISACARSAAATPQESEAKTSCGL
jgi:hypothetical protein